LFVSSATFFVKFVVNSSFNSVAGDALHAGTTEPSTPRTPYLCTSAVLIEVDAAVFTPCTSAAVVHP